jgi:hypothetical protein
VPVVTTEKTNPPLPIGEITGPRPNNCSCTWSWSAEVETDDGMYLKRWHLMCFAHPKYPKRPDGNN